ncbi:ATPase P-type heavy metal translocating [Fusarium albosuccineum]|uniref:ATPase P-type heavy metal translocating n=1 Tax=Fusarium albosuccineum TaxID=1237068 RepID=A0A8H4LDE6_9HYPO|nr:ATPase P-type heavy metal translocating [Fusarium albosuccineum]
MLSMARGLIEAHCKIKNGEASTKLSDLWPRELFLMISSKEQDRARIILDKEAQFRVSGSGFIGESRSVTEPAGGDLGARTVNKEDPITLRIDGAVG